MSFHRCLCGLLLAALCSACSQDPKPIPEIYFVAEHNGGEFPTELLFANDKVWLAQLKSDTLYQAKQFPFVEPPSAIKSTSPVASPHFMAASDQGVYVSEGRGDSVRYFSFDGEVAGKKLDLEQSLQRPHGLCIKDDWLYIADSVGSRLLRRHLESGRTEVFADVDKKIAYGRQLLCRRDGLWLSNSYEGAFKLNPGLGSNILRISDFKSGKVEVIASFTDTNTTGIAVLDDRLLLIGRWSGKYDLVAIDLVNRQLIGTLFVSNKELDAPYGITVDEQKRRFYVAFLGINPNKSEASRGAILEWKY